MSEKNDPDPIGCGCLTVVFIIGVLVGSSKLSVVLRDIAAFFEP